MKRLNHPNICKLHEIYENDEYVNLVMEYLPGNNLRSRVKAKKYFNEVEASEVMRQLLKIVSYIHKKEIIHRDLKPRNIMFTYILLIY